MKNISILGSTGSIGTNALDVIRKSPGRFQVGALAAGGNVELLARQIAEFSPQLASVKGEKEAQALKQIIGNKTKIFWGQEGLDAVALWPRKGTVVIAIPGIRALISTLKAIDSGLTIALASKEVLVAAGELVMKRSQEKGIKILPVDSEHSGIFQCLRGEKPSWISKIILTASGGPFLRLDKHLMSDITPEQALNHPRWKMGKKVSLDSATLMNKGLEVIEAHHLFQMDWDKIEVAIHPQSLVHALIETVDGSLLAQLASPDMRLPISLALNYPERLGPSYGALDIRQAGTLNFSEPDLVKFPCLELAYQAGKKGGTMPTVLNAANEEAGQAFLKQKINFTSIPMLVKAAMDAHIPGSSKTLKDILAADEDARKFVRSTINNL